LLLLLLLEWEVTPMARAARRRCLPSAASKASCTDRGSAAQFPAWDCHEAAAAKRLKQKSNQTPLSQKQKATARNFKKTNAKNKRTRR
jgi:hypothetical protein